MLRTINDILLPFRDSFTRERTFYWAIITILGFMVREDSLGVTSIIRALYLSPSAYENLLHFFHSNAWNLLRYYETELSRLNEILPKGPLQLNLDNLRA